MTSQICISKSNKLFIRSHFPAFFILTNTCFLPTFSHIQTQSQICFHKCLPCHNYFLKKGCRLTHTQKKTLKKTTYSCFSLFCIDTPKRKPFIFSVLSHAHFHISHTHTHILGKLFCILTSKKKKKYISYTYQKITQHTVKSIATNYIFIVFICNVYKYVCVCVCM